MKNFQKGQFRGKWQLGVRTYRSTLNEHKVNSPSERTMCALTMSENVFVLIDDPHAPTPADLALESSVIPTDPPHYRNTFLTLSPPGALEQLLTLLHARWIPTRQAASGIAQHKQASGQQLSIEGHIFAIGNDWIVRAGHVILAGGTVKGMLLEVWRDTTMYTCFNRFEIGRVSPGSRHEIPLIRRPIRTRPNC